MVSINKNFDQAQTNANTGATFFNNSAEDDGRLVTTATTPPHQPQHHHHFTPLNTIKHVTFHLLVSTAISIVGIVLAVLHSDLEHRCRAYFIMMYLQAAFWVITLVVDYFLKKTHHQLRIRGYLEFYQKTYTLHRLPIYVTSLWTTFLMLVQTLVNHYYPENFILKCINGEFIAPIAYITGIMCVQTLVLYVIHGLYITKVSGFNNSQHQPDVQRDHLVEASIRPTQPAQQSQPQPPAAAPLSQTLTQTADLLARQADLIRHLREHNEKLSNKLATTTAELRSLQSKHSVVNNKPSL